MAFWNKKPTENVDITLKEEIRLLKSRLTRVEAEILDIGTAQDIIRNKVLRKIQYKKPGVSEEIDNSMLSEDGFLKTN